MASENNILFGKLTRTHGYQGQLILRASIDAGLDKDKVESVFLMIDGIPVPFFVEELSEKNFPLFIIRFEGIDKEDLALKLVGTEVYISESHIINERSDELSFRNFLGFILEDQDKHIIGEITDFLDIPGNSLFAVKHEGKEVWIPVNPGLILGIETENKIIKLEIREGLINI